MCPTGIRRGFQSPMKQSRRSRLSGAEQYGAVFAKPNVTRDALFKVLSRPNGLSYHRLGMAVSRRVCRLAVGRNRLKRIIRESFRQHPKNQARIAALDFVVLPTPVAATISNHELFSSLQKHWRRQEKAALIAVDRRND